MPKRIHKYDLGTYPQILLHDERRARKAYYYVERLRQLDPKFDQVIRNIQRQFSSGKLNESEANKKINSEIESTLQRHH